MSVSDIARRPIARLKGGERAVTVLGATGSIGASTLDLLRRGRDGFRVEALTAGRNVKALANLAREFNARVAVIADAALYGELKELLAGSAVEAAAGEDAVVEAAERSVDWLMAAITGASGLKPTLAAIERGNTVALANKECLVCAGALFMRRAAAVGATVLPVDSEHNAVFQALASGNRGEVKRVILTASGGPFRTWTLEQIKAATLEQALKHPNWSMGAKVTIDSATLMNKGLEMIEAQHLFALAPEEIDVIVHPQSVVHSLVEYCDGSFVAQLGSPDMRIPIAHCLAWPERLAWEAPRLDLAKVAALTFEEPDLERFPALGLAKYALTRGGAAATVLNAADEVAVAAFIAGNLSFTGIAQLVESTIAGVEKRGLMAEPAAIEAAMAVDHIARSLARELLPQIAAKAS
jgi:1-deoxy-D-xylulose-5-phosphate reductoisomerase